MCGYAKSKRALVFHHRDPKDKKFGIGAGHSRSWNEIQRELDKCLLLCANCHAEHHDKEDILRRPAVGQPALYLGVAQDKREDVVRLHDGGHEPR